MSRRSRLLAALATAAVIGVGCSDTSAETGSTASGTPTGSGSGTSTGTSAGRSGDEHLADRDKAVKFAGCMRNNGLSDFPDPDAKGKFVYGIGSPVAWKKAVDACKDLQPPGTLSAKRTPRQQTATLRFARCMRGNGVQDFPDPANGEPLVDTTRIPSSNRAGGMSILNAAMEQCRGAMDEAAAGR